MPLSAFHKRISQGTYTESDAARFFVEARFENGPFIREVGDFVAHPTRDRGRSFGSAIALYSQVSFFQRFQSTKKTSPPLHGPCDWWLRPYLMHKLNKQKQSNLTKKFKLSKAELRERIASWFPAQGAYPVEISVLDPFLYEDLLNEFSKVLQIEPAFKINDVQRELKRAMKKYSLPTSNIEPLIVATCILLNGKTVELFSGISAQIRLSISKQKSQTWIVEREGKPFPCTKIFADGEISLSLSTSGSNKFGLVDVGSSFLETNISTAAYFDRNLVTEQSDNTEIFDLSENLSFDSSKEFPVFT